MDLSKLQEQLKQQSTSSAPVHLWDPPFCGDMDLCIKQDGSWFYMGTPITRQSLTKLFSSVLKKEADKYYLVTPVEKVGIRVEDVPFVVTEWEQKEDYLIFKTSLDNQFTVTCENPVELRYHEDSRTELPYVLVRKNLYARLHQNVFYQLVELGVETTTDEGTEVIVTSGQYCFSLGKVY